MLKNTKKILRKLITLNSSSKITFKENSANMEHYDTILMILYYFTHDMGTVCSVALVMSDSTILWIVACQFLCPWDCPGKNTGVGCHALHQGGLPDPGTEPASPASLVLQEGFFTF